MCRDQIYTKYGFGVFYNWPNKIVQILLFLMVEIEDFQMKIKSNIFANVSPNRKSNLKKKK